MTINPLKIAESAFSQPTMSLTIWMIVFVMVIMMIGTALDTAHASEMFSNVLDKDGIKVFTRTIKGSRIDQIKGEGVVNAPLSVCVAVIKDVSHQKDWVANTKKSRLVRRINNNHVIMYLLTDLPWPVSDRETVIERKISYDYNQGKVVIDLTGIDDASVPINNENVRVRHFKGKFVLSYLKPDQTRLTYSLQYDPGGYIPVSIANLTSKIIPYKTIIGMRKMVNRPEFILKAKKSGFDRKLESALHGTQYASLKAQNLK